MTEPSIIEVHPHGVVFRFPLPLSLAAKIEAISAAILEVPARRLVTNHILDRRVNGLSVTTKAGLKLWFADLDALPVAYTTGTAWLDEWIDRGDVGASSATIANYYDRRVPCKRRAAPLDAADFARCYTLLELAAKNGAYWRERMATDPPPEFATLVPHWDRLTELHLCGDYAELNAIIRRVT
jgi:hypothetical protein